MGPEHLSHEQPESIERPDQAPNPYELPSTQALELLKAAAVEALRTGDEAVEALGRFQVIGEEIVDQFQEGSERMQAQIALLIATGLVRHEAGQVDAARDDFDAAILYADNLGKGDEVAELIRASLERFD